MRDRDDGTIEQGLAIAILMILCTALGWQLRDKNVFFLIEQRPTVEQAR